MMADGEHFAEIEDRPRLYPDLTLIWDSFWELNCSRQVGMAEGYIPLTEILAYMALHEIDDFDERLFFVKRIQFLDKKYLEFRNQKK